MTGKRDAEIAPPTLGSQLASRFSRLGLKQELPELRGQPARPADVTS